eukprot:3087010-Amphidinium_carterae.1
MARFGKSKAQEHERNGRRLHGDYVPDREDDTELCLATAVRMEAAVTKFSTCGARSDPFGCTLLGPKVG